MALSLPWAKRKAKIVWLDLGDLGDLVHPAGPHEQWQDHGLGLLRTILHQNGIQTDMFSTRAVTSWEQLAKQMKGYDMLLMNVRSYTFPVALKAAQLFKEVNPQGMVLAGGMHATVAPTRWSGPRVRQDLPGAGRECHRRPGARPDRLPARLHRAGAKVMAEWPMIDRTLWPKPASWPRLRRKFNWPLEPECGWGRGPVATILTSRVCPWQCVFCNENSYIPNMGRKPVDAGHRRAELPRPQVRRRLGRHPRLDVLPEPELAARSGSRSTRARPTSAGPTGRRARRHRAPVARPVRGAGARDQLEHDLHRL
jgi:anaerobic magnesium-protoporphyrin IX monomethyl ester cyclase